MLRLQNHPGGLRAALFVLAGLFLTLASVETGHAQVIALYLKDKPKVLKKYADRLVHVNGKPAVLGEIRVGLEMTETGFTTDRKSSPELWVADPAKPELEAYALDRRGKIKAGSKQCILRLDWSHIQDNPYAAIVMRHDSLPSLSREYVLHREKLGAFRESRDRLDRTTTEWAAHHVRYVAGLERLQKWCSSTLWPKYARKMDKEIKKESKAHRGAAIRARHDQALASLKDGELKPKLIKAIDKFSDGADTFLVRETQHLRVVFIDLVDADAVDEALLLGEEIIEGFRAEFVDPFLGDEYEDYVPDGLFHEFFITPPGDEAVVAYTKALYGLGWSNNRQVRLEMGGASLDGDRRKRYRNWYKHRDQLDLQGIVAHGLGHSLAGHHYGNGRIRQDWLTEALGYHISFEYLGRNTVTCKAFGEDPEGYVKRERKAKEGEKTVGEGRREVYNRVALELGQPIQKLARRTLYEMDDADLAKAWSFFDYIARAEGKPGQQWLRAAADAADDPQTFVNNWREAAAEILGVEPGLAFTILEDRWRAFASAQGGESD